MKKIQSLFTVKRIFMNSVLFIAIVLILPHKMTNVLDDGIIDHNIREIKVNVDVCLPIESKKIAIHKMLQDAGVFTNKQEIFVKAAQRHGIDPALLVAIAMLETGRGTSTAVNERNNPGGLMNPRTDTLFVYDTIEEGIMAMASNLNRLYISEGLTTVENIGKKYAPIGAKNDPTNLNKNWIPQVKLLVKQLEGDCSHKKRIDA